MKYTKKALFVTLILLVAGLVIGCKADSVEVGMVETHLGNEWHANYTTFSGTKADTFRADAGQTLVVEYDVVVEEGMLDIQVENPDGEVDWKVALEDDDVDTVQVPLEREGRYTLRIRGESTGGGWDLTWEVQ